MSLKIAESLLPAVLAQAPVIYPVGFSYIYSKMFYYTYVLYSHKDLKFYTGYTNNLINRLEQHQTGQVPSTKYRRPLILLYWEGCLNQEDATRREKYLKSGNCKRYLNNRLKNYFAKLKNPTG